MASRVRTGFAATTFRDLPDCLGGGSRHAPHMTLHPKKPTDLMLAPVAAEIDVNLQRLRDKAGRDLDVEIALELNRESPPATREARATEVLRVGLRDVNLHGWSAEISDDASRLHLSGGSVSLDLGLSAEILRYIDGTSDIVLPLR